MRESPDDDSHSKLSWTLSETYQLVCDVASVRLRLWDRSCWDSMGPDNEVQATLSVL